MIFQNYDEVTMMILMHCSMKLLYCLRFALNDGLVDKMVGMIVYVCVIIRHTLWIFLAMN